MALSIGVRLVELSHTTCGFFSAQLRHIVSCSARKAKQYNTTPQEEIDGYIYFPCDKSWSSIHVYWLISVKLQMKMNRQKASKKRVHYQLGMMSCFIHVQAQWHHPKASSN